MLSNSEKDGVTLIKWTRQKDEFTGLFRLVFVFHMASDFVLHFMHSLFSISFIKFLSRLCILICINIVMNFICVLYTVFYMSADFVPLTKAQCSMLLCCVLILISPFIEGIP